MRQLQQIIYCVYIETLCAHQRLFHLIIALKLHAIPSSCSTNKKEQIEERKEKTISTINYATIYILNYWLEMERQILRLQRAISRLST